jgi:hypothetical protein
MHHQSTEPLPSARLAEVTACVATCAGPINGGIQFIFDFVDRHSKTKYHGVHARWHNGEWEIIEFPFVRDRDTLRDPLLSALEDSRQTVTVSSDYKLSLEAELDVWRRNLFLLCGNQSKLDDGFENYLEMRMENESSVE